LAVGVKVGPCTLIYEAHKAVRGKQSFMGTTMKAVFDEADLDPRFKWMNPPSTWFVDADESALVVMPRANSDFWQRTHYLTVEPAAG